MVAVTASDRVINLVSVVALAFEADINLAFLSKELVVVFKGDGVVAFD